MELGSLLLPNVDRYQIDSDSNQLCRQFQEPDGNSTTGDVGCYFRFGLAHSADGGHTFQWVGYVVEPEISFLHTVHGSRWRRPAWFPNMGLANYIETPDGYFQIYYGDSHDLDENNNIRNATDGAGQAGNPDQGVAVVRAKISDVVAAAKQHKSAPWMKWHKVSVSTSIIHIHRPKTWLCRRVIVDIIPLAYKL